MNKFASKLFFIMPILFFANFMQPEVKDYSPFLYFYSEQEKAFLIERAGGTDIRVLSKYTLPENHLIGGPGWSPSGKNFAWFSSSEYGPYVDQPSFAFLVNDQHRTLPLLSGLGEVSLMEWSPINDLLLVTRVREGSSSISGSILEMYIFDENAKILLREAYVQEAVDYIEWSPHGDYVLIYFHTNSSKENGIYKMRVVSPDGRSQERDFYQQSPFCSLPRWSVNNVVTYFDITRKYLVLESLLDNKVKAQLNLQSKIPRFVDWSPNGQYALVYTTSNCQEDTSQVWFLSITQKALELVADDVELPELPYRNRLVEADSGVYPFSTWSQNSVFSAFISSGQLVIFDPRVSKANRINPATSNEGQVDSVKWASNDLVVFTWTEKSSSGDSIYSYNPITSEIQLLIPSESGTPYIGYFSLSPDEAYLAYVSSSKCGDVCIMNLTGKAQVPVYLQSDLAAELPVDEVIWHPRESWLFVLGEIDRGSGLRLVNVVSASGMAQRDLGVCKLGTSCFGWMPSLTPN